MKFVKTKPDIPLDDVFRQIASGNEHAYRLCCAVYNFIQLVDDLYDGEAVEPGEVVQILLDFVDNLAFNEVFLARRHEIVAVLRQSALAWLASERPRDVTTPAEDQFVAGILKSQYQDVFYEIAYWVGGLAHATTCAGKFRMYSPDASLPAGSE